MKSQRNAREMPEKLISLAFLWRPRNTNLLKEEYILLLID
jgi:hypothetical protein